MAQQHWNRSLAFPHHQSHTVIITHTDIIYSPHNEQLKRPAVQTASQTRRGISIGIIPSIGRTRAVAHRQFQQFQQHNQNNHNY